MKLRMAMMALLAAVIALPVHAGDNPKPHKFVSETDARMISNMVYAQILGQAVRKGWRYTPEQIESGYKRHFDEFKLQLIDRGYTILVGEAGA
jgi:hypothetical protein